VWRERNFGAHCLNALKNEVHRAEETDDQLKTQHEQAPQHLPNSGTENAVVVTTKELPPWLQPRRRAREKKDQAVAVDTLKVKAENASELCASSLSPATLCDATSALIQQPLAGDVQPSLDVSTHKDAKQSMDATESDASTDVPEVMDGSEDLEAIEASKLHGNAVNCSMSLSLEGGCQKCEATNCPTQEGRLQFCDTIIECPLETASKAGPGRKDGRHSRFRKDIVNLNKAVRKWLVQEGKGEICHSQVLDRIRRSSVAQQLRVLHADEFDEDQFLQDALKHAKKAAEEGVRT